jgi:hypothetical protein
MNLRTFELRARLEDVVDSFGDQYQVERGVCTAESKNAVHDMVDEGQGVEGTHRSECSGQEMTAMAVSIDQSL